jgi:hypothetical protein
MTVTVQMRSHTFPRRGPSAGRPRRIGGSARQYGPLQSEREAQILSGMWAQGLQLLSHSVIYLQVAGRREQFLQ